MKHNTASEPLTSGAPKFLFFDLMTSGHHVEFLYHLIKYRIEHPECANFLLLTHPDFINLLSDMGLPKDWQSKGITIIHPSQTDMDSLSKKRSAFKKAQFEFRILKKHINEYQVERCYIMSLNRFQFALGSREARSLPCRIRGILFNPFGEIGTREPVLFTTLRKHLQLKWILKNRKFDHIYILNDDKVAAWLNKKYIRKNFFISLPDPILIQSKGIEKQIDTGIPIRSEKYRFLLFGSLSARKGIFLVLEALKLIPKDINAIIEFVFAGKIVTQNRNSFLTELYNIRNSRPDITIHHLDEFIPYKAIPELFSNSDCVLTPYISDQSSSGVIGHAALHGKPVIGPDHGLIGELIRTYHLGRVIDAMDARKLADTMQFFCNNKVSNHETKGRQRYVEERHPNLFVSTLITE